MNKSAWLGRLAALLILFASAVQLGAQPKPPSPLDGLYVATKSGLELNWWTNRLEYEAGEEYYLFFPSGRVYNALPKGGRFDYAESVKRDPKNTGTYRFAGNEILFRWASGDSEHFSFAREGESLVIGGQDYDRIGNFDGLQLEGHYAAASRAEVPGGILAGETQVAFGRDGKFRFQSASGRASGTYQISGNRLTLMNAAGAADHLTFFILPENKDEPVPRLIYLDGRPFLLQH